MSLSAASLEQGPFVVIRRGTRNHIEPGMVSYMLRTGSWGTSRDKAWKFDTEEAAKFAVRSRPGDVVRLADLQADDGTTGRRDHGLNGLNGAEVAAGSMLPAQRSLVPSGPLEVWESNALADAERTIERGLKNFLEVGAALLVIRDGRLYRATHKSFEEYMQSEWDLSARHGHRLVDAAVTTRNLLTTGQQDNGTTGLQTPAEKHAASIVVGKLAPGVLPSVTTDSPKTGARALPAPTSESQVRPLKGLSAEKQREAWDKATSAAGGKVPTAKGVKRAVQEVAPRKATDRTDDTDAEKTARRIKGLLDQAQNTVIEIRALQDLVVEHYDTGDPFVKDCDSWVRDIEHIEKTLKEEERALESGRSKANLRQKKINRAITVQRMAGLRWQKAKRKGGAK